MTTVLVPDLWTILSPMNCWQLEGVKRNMKMNVVRKCLTVRWPWMVRAAERGEETASERERERERGGRERGRES